MVDKAQQDFISRLTVIKGNKKDESANPVKLIVIKNKEFETWCMPQQLTGYIKCKAHNFF